MGPSARGLGEISGDDFKASRRNMFWAEGIGALYSWPMCMFVTYSYVLPYCAAS